MSQERFTNKCSDFFPVNYVNKVSDNTTIIQRCMHYYRIIHRNFMNDFLYGITWCGICLHGVYRMDEPKSRPAGHKNQT